MAKNVVFVVKMNTMLIFFSKEGMMRTSAMPASIDAQKL